MLLIVDSAFFRKDWMHSLALGALFASTLIAKAIALFNDESPGDFFFLAINSSFSYFSLNNNPHRYSASGVTHQLLIQSLHIHTGKV